MPLDPGNPGGGGGGSTPPPTPTTCPPGQIFMPGLGCRPAPNYPNNGEGNQPGGFPPGWHDPNTPPGGGPSSPAPGAGPCPPNTPEGPASCCPSGTVYRTDTKQCEEPDARSKRGEETCDEMNRPDSDCTRNQQWCDFDTRQWRCDHGAPSGPGGGGGGKGPGGGGGVPKPSGPPVPGFNWDRFTKLLDIGKGFSDPAMKWLNGVLSGDATRYSPQVMEWLAGQSRAGAEAQGAQNMDALNTELASRGVARGNYGVTQAQGMRAQTDQRFSNEMAGHRVTKVQADFEDKLSAVDRMLKYVNDLQSYAAQLNMTEADREKLEATIKLGYEQLRQQMLMLDKQLASNKDLLGMSIRSNELLAMLRLQFGL